MLSVTRVSRFLGVLSSLCLHQAVAFLGVTPRSVGRSAHLQSSRLYAFPPELLTPLSVPNVHVESVHESVQSWTDASSLILSVDLVELSKTVGLAALGVFLFFTAFTFLTVNVLMPAAAKQVEEITKETDPALWDEYVRKLQPGETMATRPDLVQELGKKALELQDRQFQQQQQRAQAERSQESSSSSSSSKEPEVYADSKPQQQSSTTRTTNSSPMDVEIVDRNQWDD